jgi:AcrR family transcriptional regulator
MPRPNVSHERIPQILQAATAVFARLGFQQARMDDVAAEAGVSKGTLYLYFASKDDIIAALMRELFEGEVALLCASLEKPGTVAERLQALTDRVGSDLERMRTLLPMAWEFYAVAARQASVRAFSREYFRACREALVRLVEDGIASGELRAVDPEAAALAIAALYEGLLILWVTDPEVVHPETQGEAAIQLLLAGMAAEPAAPARRTKRTGGTR